MGIRRRLSDAKSTQDTPLRLPTICKRCCLCALKLPETDSKQEQVERLRDLLIQVREIASDAEDVVETFIFEVSSSYMKASHNKSIRAQINSIRSRIQIIFQAMQIFEIKFVVGEGTSSSMLEVKRNLRRSYPDDEDNDVIILEGSKADLTAQLTKEEDRLCIVSVLEQKRYLVVLDDIWRVDAWDCIKGAFPPGKKGSKLLFTTRNMDVATSAYPLSSPIIPPFLTDDESWELLHRKAFPKHIVGHGEKDCSPEFKNLGREMVKKCGGLPLAVVVLGGLLKTKNSLDEWRVEGRRGMNGGSLKYCSAMSSIVSSSSPLVGVAIKPSAIHNRISLLLGISQSSGKKVSKYNFYENYANLPSAFKNGVVVVANLRVKVPVDGTIDGTIGRPTDWHLDLVVATTTPPPRHFQIRQREDDSVALVVVHRWAPWLGGGHQRCSVSGHTKATSTLNSFEKDGDGEAPSECDNKYHSNDTPVVALSTGWFNNMNRCLQNITIFYNGQSVNTMVVDECDSTMGCDADHDY
ncbi:hypothetical protein FNV43_RR15059 [Rhamnella rubrinervis]|uniref:NB-ARC domain-containing protein n=1 Tax=Rhamnella rubrinervis TaxID=2594499 RepID=A0A8K0GX60_9ROSA|nr:hypothetical protein FNV43_RR15059 [Rhamnella rubrinervis]